MGAVGIAKPPQQAVSGLGFFTIRVASLRVDTVVHFDLYVQSDALRIPVLYRARNLPFSEESKERLTTGGVSELFVPSEQAKEYRKYIESNLNAILADSDIPIEERSQVLHSSAAGLVRDVFREPRAGDVIRRSQTLVENAVGFAFGQKAAVEGLLRVTATDYYTYTHCVNVFVFGISLARRLGLDSSHAMEFGNGALLHDIGKCLIPLSVLNRPGKLTAEEWKQMQYHPVHGYNLLKSHGLKDGIILDVTRHHHEKCSGKGYPDGLPADEISVFARMSTICDIFDALTTRRAYKEALPSFEALRLMKTEMGHDLDRELFATFVEMLGNPSAEKVSSGA